MRLHRAATFWYLCLCSAFFFCGCQKNAVPSKEPLFSAEEYTCSVTAGTEDFSFGGYLTRQSGGRYSLALTAPPALAGTVLRYIPCAEGSQADFSLDNCSLTLSPDAFSRSLGKRLIAAAEALYHRDYSSLSLQADDQGKSLQITSQDGIFRITISE